MGGDRPAPTVPESTAQMMAAYTRYLPDLMRVTNAELPNAAQTQVNIAQQTSPALAQLQQQLYALHGPEMARIGNQITREQALSQAGTDAAVLAGPGRSLINTNRAISREEDPEFYATRELMSGRLGELINSVDLTGGISAGEREEIQRSVNRDNQARGIDHNRSQSAVVENAMTFGNAQNQRRNQQQDRLGQALNVGNQFLPASRTGVDNFQVATGRSSQPNPSMGQFQGVNTQLGQNANQMPSQFLGQMGDLSMQRNDINANRRDSLDRFNESWSSVVGSL